MPVSILSGKKSGCNWFQLHPLKMVAEAGLEPATSGLWAAVRNTFAAIIQGFGTYWRLFPTLRIHWNLPNPLCANPVWVKIWVKNVVLKMGQPSRQLSLPNLDLRHIQDHFGFTFPMVTLPGFSRDFSSPVVEPTANTGSFSYSASNLPP